MISVGWRPLGRRLRTADTLAAGGRVDDALDALRSLSLQRFGRLLLDVPDRFPALKAALPEMPSEAVQRDWTGNHGRALLRQSTAFVRTTEKAYRRWCGRPLAGATILDYGCGWGRLLRLMYRYSPASRIYGVDPWDRSLEICRATRLRGHLALCEYVPRQLPFPDVTFDLVYAFSVFTHLSEKTSSAAMAAIRPRVRDGGLVVLTVRPPEYWKTHSLFPAGTDEPTLQARHREHGFAFVPHHRPPIDGDVTFGDASISLDYIRRVWTEWTLVGDETNRVDRYQRVVFLRPAGLQS